MTDFPAIKHILSAAEVERLKGALAEIVALTPGPNEKPDSTQGPDYYCGFMVEQELGAIAREALQPLEQGHSGSSPHGPSSHTSSS